MQNKGKLIVFEGLDGSGKSSLTKLLARRLRKEGYKVSKIDFPQYGKKSAGIIEEYLIGKYGGSEDVGPYRASIFYACDRYDASFKIKKWIKQGRVVISDRYVASNIGHQGGKIKQKEERKRYVKWINKIEYEIFAIPKPDLCFILKTSPGLAKKMAPRITDLEKKKKRKYYLKGRITDIHEKDISHLSAALSSYLDIARQFPEDFKVVECVKDGRLIPLETIHEQVWKIIKKIL